MKLTTILSAATLVLILTGAVHAASITNRDTQDHKLTIFEGENSKDVILKPNQSHNEVCAESCVIRLNDDENNEFEIEANELVSVEDGSLVYDGTPQDQGSSSDNKQGPEENRQ